MQYMDNQVVQIIVCRVLNHIEVITLAPKPVYLVLKLLIANISDLVSATYKPLFFRISNYFPTFNVHHHSS